MTFDVEVGEAIRTVTVHRKGPVLHVEMGGRTHVVDARRVGDGVWSLLVAPAVGARPVTSVDVAVNPSAAAAPGGRSAVRPHRRRASQVGAEPAPGAFDVHLAGRTIAVQVRQTGAFGRPRQEGRGASPTPGRRPGAVGPQRVVAPMPGKIVRVLVKAGDDVKARQGLVVVEAMKMENELRALRDGRVREVTVTEGQLVDAGDILMVVE